MRFRRRLATQPAADLRLERREGSDRVHAQHARLAHRRLERRELAFDEVCRKEVRLPARGDARAGILPADAAGILNSRRMSELIQDVKQRFDLVLVDSPPILGVSDASVLASEVDLTMLVVQHRKYPRSVSSRA